MNNNELKQGTITSRNGEVIECPLQRVGAVLVVIDGNNHHLLLRRLRKPRAWVCRGIKRPPNAQK
ncbi:hypothetical protein SLEP1_g58410 [Rubroshorea leprosula]|uniref:Uncharacterized protein n=1 Tax=Rubroshorea leprosula TaxID=152421 RepID=A0AAV5MPM2_9ROSI|nr:hypothetical protein SLEP1_g58410 [Rubroshorea leprosula]